MVEKKVFIFYFRQSLTLGDGTSIEIPEKILSERKQFTNVSTFLITCTVAVFMFRIDRSQSKSLSKALQKDMMMSVLLQVFNFRQHESRIQCFLH